jgi:hypothetical protein
MIMDNGFTLKKTKSNLNDFYVQGNVICFEVRCLADLEDWLEDALAEVKTAIEERG